MRKIYPFLISIFTALPIFSSGQSSPGMQSSEPSFGSVIISGEAVNYIAVDQLKSITEKPFNIEAVYESSECSSELTSIAVNNAHFPLTWYELNENGQRVHTLFNPQLNHFSNQTTYVVFDITQHSDTIFIDFQKSIALRKVFPNPHKDRLYIDYSTMETTPLSIYIMDVTGRKVYDYSTRLIEGQNRLTLHFDQLGEGMYFLSMKGKCINELLKIIHLD